jgi:hypothetical protein
MKAHDLVLFAEMLHVGKDKINVATTVVELSNASQIIRRPAVVGVQKADHVCACLRHATLKRGKLATVAATDQKHTFVSAEMFAQQRIGAIGGTIVNHDDLRRLSALRQRALHRLNHKVTVVVAGDDHRKACHWLIHAKFADDKCMKTSPWRRRWRHVRRMISLVVMLIGRHSPMVTTDVRRAGSAARVKFHQGR